MLYIELSVLCATRSNYIGSIVMGTNRQVKTVFSNESPKTDACILVNVEVTVYSCFISLLYDVRINIAQLGGADR